MPSTPLHKTLRARGLYPHQAGFVEEVLSQGAGARVLLADDVGLGKRVACAALVSAYEARTGGNGAYLVLAPSARVNRWLEYLGRYAPEVFPAVVDAPGYRQLQVMEDGQPWRVLRCAVTSLDFAKEATRAQELCSEPWDIVIVDEAHLCTPHSQRGHLFEGLWCSAQANVVVAVTATPMKGTGEEFIAVRDTRTKLIRRSAAALEDWEGQPLFGGAERSIEQVCVNWSSPEQAFIKRVLDAARSLSASRTPHHSFLATQLVRQLGSSFGTIEATLRRQLVTLRSWELEGAEVEDEPDAEASYEEEGNSSAEVEPFSEQSCRALLDLLEQIDEDRKWAACRGVIQRLRDSNVDRIVIFTDYADTAGYIGGLCSEAGWAAEVVTGRVPAGQRETSLEKCAASGSVLVLTSGAAEGTSLPSFRHAVHYDLPWHAARLFQRLGRLERLSALRDVTHHYFLVDDATAQPVLISKLLKLENIALEDFLPSSETQPSSNA